MPLRSIILACLAAAMLAQPTSAQAGVEDAAYSAAYWRDICSGDRPGLARAEQERMCGLYLSSFHDATDEYAEAGLKLFCAPDPIPAETMRRAFLSYVAELPESAEFFPAGRVLILALRRRYPCDGHR
jgi:hypothetical protein